MLTGTAHSANAYRRFLRAVITHALAIAVLFTLLVPHHALACDPILGASSPAITASDGAGLPLGDPADSGLAQHASCASCSCQTGVCAPTEPAALAGFSLNTPGRAASDGLPPPSPAFLPFKPPRSLPPQI